VHPLRVQPPPRRESAPHAVSSGDSGSQGRAQSGALKLVNTLRRRAGALELDLVARGIRLPRRPASRAGTNRPCRCGSSSRGAARAADAPPRRRTSALDRVAQLARASAQPESARELVGELLQLRADPLLACDVSESSGFLELIGQLRQTLFDRALRLGVEHARRTCRIRRVRELEAMHRPTRLAQQAREVGETLHTREARSLAAERDRPHVAFAPEHVARHG
jgi:hypothetical protein